MRKPLSKWRPVGAFYASTLLRVISPRSARITTSPFIMRYHLSLALASSLAFGLTAQSNSALTTTGQELTATISGVPASLTGSETQLLATCMGALGAPSTQQANVIFVFDCSGSMSSSLASSGLSDFNGDGAIDRIDAAGLGFATLLGSVAGASANVAVVPFASRSGLLDMSAAPGVQNFTTIGTDSNSNGVDDILDVLESHDVGGATVFSSVTTGTGTNFNVALQSVNSLVALAPAGVPTFVFFLTDGSGSLIGPGGGGPLDQTVTDGTTVVCIGIGPGVAQACAPGGALDLIATATGGDCIFEPDPSNLSASLPMTTSTEITSLSLEVNGSVVASQSGMFGQNVSDTIDILSLLTQPTNTITCTTGAADGTSVSVTVTTGLSNNCVTLGFDTEDDMTTPLGNGQQVTATGNFGNFVTIEGMSASGLNAAVFDTNPVGPNALSSDGDLLVGRGNCLILQEVAGQTTPGTYDTPDDDVGGGSFTISFLQAATPCSVDLIDVDSDPRFDQTVTVTLTDAAGSSRTYTVPPGFTEDVAGQGGLGYRTLDLTTTNVQPGFTSDATATEDPNYSPDTVVTMTIVCGSSAGIDNLAFIPGAIVTAPAGSFHTVAPGCGVGKGPVLATRNGQIPTIESRLELTVDGLGQVFSVLAIDTVQRPMMDLTTLGAPGCSIGVAGRLTALLGSNGSASLDVNIPTSANGLWFRMQVIDVNPTANALGVAFSNSVEGTVGQ